MSKVCIVFYVFDDLNRFLDSFILNTEIVSAIMGSNFSELNQLNCHKKFAAVLKVDGYFLSVFSRMIQISDFYSKMVAANLCKSLRVDRVNSDVKIKFQLIKPKLEILDYAWNKRLTDLVSQKQELEHAMSWLSTLGGAFSALGDTFENYVSIKQYQVS